MTKTSKNTEIVTVNATEERPNTINTVNAVGFDYDKQITLLSPKQRKDYLTLASSIDENDVSSIQAFGADISRVVEENGNNLLDSVRSTNNNEVIQMTNELLAQLNLIDIDELQAPSSFKRFLRRLPLINRLVMTTENVMIKYDTIKNNVDKITAKIKQSKIVSKRDNNTLQIIFDNNCEYIKNIRELIIAAKLRNEELRKNIEHMNEHPDQYSPIQIHDAKGFQNALEKRIADMQVTEYIFNQNLFQIRAIQSNNHSLADKADAIVNNVIPIWKNQLALSVIMVNQQNNIDAQHMITETTNQILKKNAELMKTNSIQVAKANEEMVVSLDTLQSTTKDLIDTITEVKKIHDEGAKMRQTLEHNLVDYGKQLNDRITELSEQKSIG